MPEEIAPNQDFDSLISVDHPEVDSQPDNYTKAQLLVSKDGMKPTAFYQHQVLGLQLDLHDVNLKMHAIEIQKGVVDAELAKYRERVTWVRWIEFVSGTVVCIATAIKSYFPISDSRAVAAVVVGVLAGLVIVLMSFRKK